MLVNLNSSEYRKKHVSLFNHPKKPVLTDFLRCDAAVSRRFADILSVSHMLREDAIIAESGKRIPAKIDTICLHGDTPEAVEMARALRTKLSAAGVTLAMF